jgi:hypothetical protein
LDFSFPKGVTLQNPPLSRFASLAVLMTGLVASAHAFAVPCDENFSSSGNFFTGSVYKTWAELPGIKPDNAYRGAYLYTVKDGWKILQADKDLGIISAAQGVSYGNGKTVPLNIAVEKSDTGAKISITYSTPGGTASPEDAIRTHFCKTVASAQAQMSGEESSAGTPVVPHPSARKAVPSRAANTALITGEQEAKIAAALSAKGLKDQRVRQNLSEATDTIKGFLQKLSCLQGYNASSLNTYAAPGHQFASNNFLSPMTSARYHDKGSCLTVVRIQGVATPALNALRFEVVYLAEDSGESIKTWHELVRQPDGQWLFNR